ncbi:MAG TPA: YhjD/YihY/BrkB family envelope integrity protein [Acidimicrobiales bacterium]
MRSDQDLADAGGSRADDAQSVRERLVERVAALRAALEERRVGSISIDAAFRALDVETETGGGVLAGAIAFRVFMFMVPYVFFVVVALGMGAAVADHDPTTLARSVGIGGLAASGVASAADLSGGSRVAAILISGFALILGARAFSKVLWVTHELIWRVREHRVRATRSGFGLILVATVGLVLALGVGWLRQQSPLLTVVSLIAYTVVPSGLWLLVSSRLPHARCPWWALLPGAALFGVGVAALHVVTVTFIAHRMASKTETYGVIGGSLSLLLWAYLFGRIITATAVINSAFWSRYVARHSQPTVSGGQS